MRDYTHTKETSMDQYETVEELLKKLCTSTTKNSKIRFLRKTNLVRK